MIGELHRRARLALRPSGFPAIFFRSDCGPPPQIK
jgi:hypothetical protein